MSLLSSFDRSALNEPSRRRSDPVHQDKAIDPRVRPDLFGARHAKLSTPSSTFNGTPNPSQRSATSLSSLPRWLSQSGDTLPPWSQPPQWAIHPLHLSPASESLSTPACPKGRMERAESAQQRLDDMAILLGRTLPMLAKTCGTCLGLSTQLRFHVPGTSDCPYFREGDRIPPGRRVRYKVKFAIPHAYHFSCGLPQGSGTVEGQYHWPFRPLRTCHSEAQAQQPDCPFQWFVYSLVEALYFNAALREHISTTRAAWRHGQDPHDVNPLLFVDFSTYDAYVASVSHDSTPATRAGWLWVGMELTRWFLERTEM